MNQRERNALDRYITGNYGEDQFRHPHTHICPGYGHEEECGEDCDDPKEPWYCGALPHKADRCLVLEEE